MASAKRPAKVQRWMDLIAALLRVHFPVTFEQLSADVPAYANAAQSPDAQMRMFERDKDELRALGVPIESVPDQDGALSRYRLRSRSFYLPYVQLSAPAATSGATTPRRPRGVGYQGIPILAFEPDELAMISRSATRVQQMRHPTLAADAATAVRKLAFDVAVVDGGVHEVMLSPYRGSDPEVLDVLDHAVRRRKCVEFQYRSLERNAHTHRRVEPYGLVFLSSQWYLVARDPQASGLRHFRVSRVSAASMNVASPQTPDFDVPADFDLWSHAESRRAWELGDGDAMNVTVRFDSAGAYAAGATALGDEDPDQPGCRRFVVRRADAFVRWLLSFGGAARPLAPESIVSAWQELARRTVERYPVAP